MTSPPALSLVVFAFNEAENVPEVLGDIVRWMRARGGDDEILFVDDGSHDGTAAAAQAVLAGDHPLAARVISHDRNRGIGAALKTGVRAASRPWVTFLPCDGQIPPAELDKLCARAADADVVLSVYRARDDGWHRKLFSAGVRGLITALHGVRLRSDGPYLFRRELFDADLLAPDTFFLNFEFPIRALRARRRMATVTIECVPRRAGSSKSTGLRRIAGVGRDLFGLKLRLWRGR